MIEMMINTKELNNYEVIDRKTGSQLQHHLDYKHWERNVSIKHLHFAAHITVNR